MPTVTTASKRERIEAFIAAGLWAHLYPWALTAAGVTCPFRRDMTGRDGGHCSPGQVLRAPGRR
jgi:hypothetical protein